MIAEDMVTVRGMMAVEYLNALSKMICMPAAAASGTHSVKTATYYLQAHQQPSLCTTAAHILSHGTMLGMPVQTL